MARSRRIRRTDSRRRVLRAAHRLFSRKGFAATSMDEIAERAKASPSSIYWHFKGGKDAILLEVLDEASRGFMTRMLDAVRREETVAAKVEVFLREAEQQMRDNPDTLRLLVQIALERAKDDRVVRRRVAEISERHYNALVAELTLMLPQAGDARLANLATLIIAMLQGIFLQWQLNPDRVELAGVFCTIRAAIAVHLAATRGDSPA